MLSEFPVDSVSLLNSSSGSVSLLACTLAERRIFGLARRTAPRDLLVSGSTTSTEFSVALITSLWELDLGMRSVIAADCIFP